MKYFSFFENEVNVQKLKWRGSQGIGLCPLPAHDDQNPSFSFSAETGLWNCFGCGEKGNAYQLAEILNMGNPQQYLSDSSPPIKNGHNGGIRPPKTELILQK